MTISDEARTEAERRFPLWLPTGDYEIDREDYSELDAKWQNADTERDRARFVQGAEWQREQDESESMKVAAQRAVQIHELEADLDMARQEYHELEEFHRLYIYPYKQRAEQAEARLDKIRDVLSSAPECDKYSDDDTISCGWKKDMIEVRRILDESGL